MFLHAQAETLEKLNKGDITGFVEEVQPGTVSTFLQRLCFMPTCFHRESLCAMSVCNLLLGSGCRRGLTAAAVHWPALYAALMQYVLPCSTDRDLLRAR